MGLTEKRIRDAKPEPKTCFLWDPAFKNFGVRIAPGGTKAFVLDFHEAGKHRRVTIARVGEMSLKAARALASDQMAAVRAGEAHLLDKRREARDLPTVADAVRRFLDEHSARRIANARMSPRTVKDYRSQCASTILPAIGARTVASVETADIERIVDPLRPVQRNRVLALASRIFTLCEHWGWRPQRTNPARGIERAVENARDRTLTPAEFASLAGALAARETSNPAAVASIRFAAMTGLRIGEVLNIQWDHVDVDSGRLLLPETKTGRRWHDLPAPALAVLDSLPRLTEFCFTNGRAGVGYKHVQAVFKAAARNAGAPDIRLHDLRRTVMTEAAAAGVGTHVLRDLLGHKSTAMADRYIRSVGNPVREARETIGNRVATMMETGKVVPLRRG